MIKLYTSLNHYKPLFLIPPDHGHYLAGFSSAPDPRAHSQIKLLNEEPMEKLLNFIDDYVFEPQLYFRVPSLYTNGMYEIQWINAAKLKWRLRPVGTKDWLEVDTNEIISQLNTHQLNLIDFEQKLRASVLQQVAFVNTFMTKAEAIFGKDAIDGAIKSNADFLKEIENTVKALIQEKSSESMTLDKEEDNQVLKREPLSVNIKPKAKPKNFLRLLGDDADFSIDRR